MSAQKAGSGDTYYDTVHTAVTVERLGLSLGILGRELDTGQQRLVLSILLSSLLQCFLLKLPSFSPLFPDGKGTPPYAYQSSYHSSLLVLCCSDGNEWLYNLPGAIFASDSSGCLGLMEEALKRS